MAEYLITLANNGTEEATQTKKKKNKIKQKQSVEKQMLIRRIYPW